MCSMFGITNLLLMDILSHFDDGEVSEISSTLDNY